MIRYQIHHSHTMIEHQEMILAIKDAIQPGFCQSMFMTVTLEDVKNYLEDLITRVSIASDEEIDLEVGGAEVNVQDLDGEVDIPVREKNPIDDVDLGIGVRNQSSVVSFKVDLTQIKKEQEAIQR